MVNGLPSNMRWDHKAEVIRAVLLDNGPCLLHGLGADCRPPSRSAPPQRDDVSERGWHFSCERETIMTRQVHFQSCD